MKMIEITSRSIMAELEKLNTRLEKAQARLVKKSTAAEKLGVAGWTDEEHRAWMQTIETKNGWLVNKEDVKKNSAWFDLVIAEDDVEEIQRRIAATEKRLAKADEKVAEYRAQVEAMEDLKSKEELQKLEFEQEQKEWAKDGITLEYRYTGKTPKGETFLIAGNNGYTERSLHCVTLYIGGETIFTSGEFWRAYAVIKNR